MAWPVALNGIVINTRFSDKYKLMLQATACPWDPLQIVFCIRGLIWAARCRRH